MKKLERINTHHDDYRGPATGSGTEHGDTWPVAMDKVNAVIDRLNGDAPGNATSNAEGNATSMAREEGQNLMAAVAELNAEVKRVVAWIEGEPTDEPQPDLTEAEIGAAFHGKDAPAMTMGSATDLPTGEAPAEPFGTRTTAGDHKGSAERTADEGGYLGTRHEPADSGFAEFSQHADEAAAEPDPEVVAGRATPVQNHTDGAFDPTGGTFKIGDGGGTAEGEPDPRALRDNPEVLGTLGGAAAGEGQIIGASEMPNAVITTGEPENRDELIQTPDGTYHPITPTADESGVVMTGAEGQSNPQPNPQGQAVEPEAPAPIATFDGEPGIPSGGTRDEESSNNRFVASGGTGQVVAEQYADNLAQKPGQAGDPRPDDEPLPVSAVIADREQERQAAEEVTAANTLKPNVDPEQAVDNPATPPSGETLDRADATANNNLRTGPK